MIPLLHIFLSIVAGFIFWQLFKNRINDSRQLQNGSKTVPDVFPRLPYFGNAIQIYYNPVEFFENCRKTYGDFFRVKLCRTNIIVTCDRQAALELSKADETDLSLYAVLRGVYFEGSCFDSSTHLAADALKKGTAFRKADVTPNLKKEAIRMVNFFKSLDLTMPITHSDQLDFYGKFVARVLFSSFLGVEMEDSMYTIALQFFALVKLAMQATQFVPMGVVHFFVRQRLLSFRHSIRAYVDNIIREYQHDSTLQSSVFFRAVCDKVDEGTGKAFTTEQASGHLLVFMFAGTQNSGTLIQQIITDLANHNDVYEELKAEVSNLIQKDDMDGILESPLLHACVIESARLYPMLFGLMRQCLKDTTLAGYSLKKGDICSISNPLLMQDGAVFKDPSKYNPHRFMGPNPEPSTSMMVTSWGSGVHLCPGKTFALLEIKMGIAYMVHNFAFKVPQKNIRINYASTAAFAERVTSIYLMPIDKKNT